LTVSRGNTIVSEEKIINIDVRIVRFLFELFLIYSPPPYVLIFRMFDPTAIPS